MPTIIYTPDRCIPPSAAPVEFSGHTDIGDGKLEPYRIRLVPGSNRVSDDELDLLEAHPDFVQYKAQGAVEVVATPAKTTKTKAAAKPTAPADPLETPEPTV